MTTPVYSRSYVLGTMALIAGIFVMIAAILVQDTTIGWPTALIDRWYFAIGAVALMVFGICARHEAFTFGVLAFFLIVGGAAQLYVTDTMWFAALHLDPVNWKEWATIGVIASEALTAAVVLAGAGPALILSETQKRLGFGRIALFVLLTGILSVPLLGFVARGAGAAYAAHIIVGIALVSIHLSVLAAMSQVKSPISGLYRLSPLVPATVTLIVSLALGYYAFERMPHVEDEVAYVFQAETFAGGALTAPAPPEAAQAGLDYPFFEVKDGRWYAATAPGWPAMLALGVAAGVPWLVNPLLAAMSVLLGHAIAARLAGRDQADLVAMMMGASPWLLAMAASLMPHTLTLVLMLFAWWTVLRAQDGARNRMRRLVLAGLALGWIFATQPFDGLVIGGLTGVWVLLGRNGSVWRAAAYLMGCVASGGLSLIYYARITGNALIQPLTGVFRPHLGDGGQRLWLWSRNRAAGRLDRAGSVAGSFAGRGADQHRQYDRQFAVRYVWLERRLAGADPRLPLVATTEPHRSDDDYRRWRGGAGDVFLLVRRHLLHRSALLVPGMLPAALPVGARLSGDPGAVSRKG